MNGSGDNEGTAHVELVELYKTCIDVFQMMTKVSASIEERLDTLENRLNTLEITTEARLMPLERHFIETSPYLVKTETGFRIANSIYISDPHPPDPAPDLNEEATPDP